MIKIIQGNYVSHEAEKHQIEILKECKWKKLKIKDVEMIIVNLYVLKLNNRASTSHI